MNFLERYRFDTSEGIGLSAPLFGINAGNIYLDDQQYNTKIALSYASLSMGKSSVPIGCYYSNLDMECTGDVYPNPIHGKGEVTLDDITGWCLIYQAQYVGLQGRYVTRMYLSMGEYFAYSCVSALTGIGVFLMPVMAIKSCKAIVAITGLVAGLRMPPYREPSASVAGDANRR